LPTLLAVTVPAGAPTPDDGNVSLRQVVEVRLPHPQAPSRASAPAGGPQAAPVQALYRTLLHQHATAADLRKALRLLAGGETLEQFEAQLLASALYFRKRAHRNNARFLADLAQDVLGRPLDAAHLQQYGGLLAHGTARTTVATLVLQQRDAGPPPASPPPASPPPATGPTTIVLAEGNNFLTEATVPVDLGQAQGTRTLRFPVNARFDTTDHTAAVEDTLLVSLVDPVNPGQTLLDRGQPGTALFALSGSAADYQPGVVRYDGTNVTIDVSSLASRTKGLLLFQLLNSDTDNGSTVTVGPVADVVDPQGTSGPVFPAATTTTPAGPALDLTTLGPAPGVRLLASNIRFDDATGRYTADLRLRNDGAATGRQVAAVFPGLPADVRLLDPSGSDAAGSPYLNFHDAIPAGGLGASAVSDPIEATFANPDHARFALTPNILTGGPNRAPTLAPVGPLTVLPGGRLEVPLTTADADGDPVTVSLRSSGPLPTGTLEGNTALVFAPTPAEVGSYSFTLVASDGAAETTQDVTLTVAADPVTTTRLSGVVEDTTDRPLAGVPVDVGGTQAVTAADGSFLLDFGSGPPPAPVLNVHGDRLNGAVVYPSAAADLSVLLGHDVYAGVNNVLSQPIFLTPTDTADETTINPAADTTVRSSALPGAAVLVKAGTLQDGHGNPYAGPLGLTEVPVGQTPAPLPPELVPDLVVTAQPGGVVFTAPAPLTLPNRVGLPAGLPLDLWSLDPATGQFEKAGAAQVSADGGSIQTTAGGIRDSSLYFVVPQAPVTGDPNADPANEKIGANANPATAAFASSVDLHSGAVQEDENLTTYQSLGVARGVTLHYDSLWADPEPIVHLRYDNVQPSPNLRLGARVKVRAGNFEYDLAGSGKPLQFGVRAGENFFRAIGPRGDYEAAIQLFAQALVSAEYVAPVELELTYTNGSAETSTSTIHLTDATVVNRRFSPYGSGWDVAGVQQLVRNTDGSVLLVKGDGHQLVFPAPPKPGDPYGSPEGDFSTLVQLADGTFRRTLKDQTVDTFNVQGLLVAERAPAGSETDYAYDASGRLLTITDPAGLQTTFAYGNNQVTVTDPAQRVTQLLLDADGNLERIVYPDTSSVAYAYDAAHHLTGITDQLGGHEQIDYGFHGRATQVTRKDGTVVLVDPVETQGVYPLSQTSDPATAPPALPVPAGQDTAQAMVGYPNDVQATTLDQLGQLVSQCDSAGCTGSVQRNADNLVTRQTNGLGQSASIAYDAHGNPVSVADPLSGSFGPEADYPVIGVPKQSVVGDINGDRIPDIITATSTGIATLLGAGDGTFGPAVNDSIGSVTGLALGDLNEDGHPDLVVTLGTGRLAVLPNRGDGSFGSPQPFGQGVAAAGLVVADFNGDGHLDVAAAEGPTSTVRVWLGRGDGSLGPMASYPVGTPGVTFPLSLVAADLNRGGVPDLFVNLYDTSTANASTSAVLLGHKDPATGKGDGTFLPRPAVPGEEGLLGDVNNDGIPDLVTANGVRLGNGDGTFAPLATPQSLSLAALADIDGDGKPDVLGLNPDVGVAIRPGLDGGVFGARVSVPFANFQNLLTVADLNGDGRPDLVAATASSSPGTFNVAVRLNSGGGLGGGMANPITATYDPKFNQPLSQTDGLGNVTRYTRDPATGNVLTKTLVGAGPNGGDLVTGYTYNAQGLVATQTDPLGRITKFDYNAAGQVTAVTSALGTPDQAVERRAYDAAGNVTMIVGPNNDVTEYTYNPTNRLTRVHDALGHDTQYTYNLAGDRVSMTDAVGNVTTYDYDAMGRLLHTTEPAPDGNPAGLVTTRGYDAQGNLASVTDSLGHTTRTIYDARNRPVETIDAKGNITVSTYDADNNLLTRTDPSGSVSTFARDARGRLTSADDPHVFTYDADNRLLSTTDADRRMITYTYYPGPDGQVETETWFDSSGKQTNVVNFSYDPVGNRTVARDKFSFLTFTYNGTNRVVTVDNNGFDGAPHVLLTYGYYPNGDVRSVTETINGQQAGVTTYEENLMGQVVGVGQSGPGVSDKSVVISYDADGRPATVTRYAGLNPDPSDLVVSSAYSFTGNFLSGLTHSNRSTTIASYAVFPVPGSSGLIDHITDADGAATYGYDKNGQLDRVTYSNPNLGSESFTFDSAGNPNGPGTQVMPGDLLTTDGQFQYVYDADGNLVSRTNTSTGQVRTFTWDNRHRLIGVLDSDSQNHLIQQVQFTYDALDRRISKTVQDATGQRTTYYVWDRDNVLLEFVDDDGPSGPHSPVLALRYLLGADAGQVLAQDDGAGHVLWLLPDPLGSTRDLVDNNGTVVNHLIYSAFGRLLFQSNPGMTTHYLFLGRAFDAETGLYYFGDRYYDPATGRFLSPSPGRFVGAASSELAGDNPYLLMQNHLVSAALHFTPRQARRPTGRSGSDLCSSAGCSVDGIDPRYLVPDQVNTWNLTASGAYQDSTTGAINYQVETFYEVPPGFFDPTLGESFFPGEENYIDVRPVAYNVKVIGRDGGQTVVRVFSSDVAGIPRNSSGSSCGAGIELMVAGLGVLALGRYLERRRKRRRRRRGPRPDECTEGARG
jgi:RHS repeat-associated protein